MRSIIIDLRESDTEKIQLTIKINFISCKDVEKENLMDSKSNNMKVMFYNTANEVADELFKSFYSRYQGNLETSMRGSDFIFDSVQLMHYKCHEVNFKLGASYIESQDWIKNKK